MVGFPHILSPLGGEGAELHFAPKNAIPLSCLFSYHQLLHLACHLLPVLLSVFPLYLRRNFIVVGQDFVEARAVLVFLALSQADV